MQEINVFSLRMGRERSVEYDVSGIRISSPDILHELLDEVYELGSLPEEIFVIICLDTKNQVIGTFKVSQGSLNASIVHPREVFKRALISNAGSIILAHNHPSGDTAPSKEDIDVTDRLVEAGELLGIRVLDHIIVGHTRYLSFKEKRLI